MTDLPLTIRTHDGRVTTRDLAVPSPADQWTVDDPRNALDDRPD